MKPEQKQLLIFIAKILILLAFASLYAIGGSGDFWGGQKWIRRWFATGILSIGMFIWTRDWKYLVAFPMIAGTLTLPYDITGIKLIGRAICGLASGLAFNMPNLFNKKWVLSGYGVLICIVTSAVLGAFNPTPNAMEEQGAIAFIFGFTYILGIETNKQKEKV